MAQYKSLYAYIQKRGDMTPEQRMESAYKADPTIGRDRLAREAGVGEKRARLFLKRKRREIAGSGDAKRGALLEKVGGLRDHEIEVILRSLKKPDNGRPKHYEWGTESVKFIACGDTHWGHKQSSPDFWWRLCDMAAKENVSSILHAGDILEGMSGRPGHVYELDAIGFDAQVELAASYIKQAPCHIKAIDGNHDAWFQEKGDIGIIVGKQLERMLPGQFIHLGQDEATITVNGLKIMLWHGRDGSSYAFSYRLQKFIEGLSGGEKPHILLSGHAHKSVQMEVRNVAAFEVGTGCFQTKFMRGKKLASHVGFWIIEAFPNENGLERIKTEWVPFYV